MPRLVGPPDEAELELTSLPIRAQCLVEIIILDLAPRPRLARTLRSLHPAAKVKKACRGGVKRCSGEA